MDVLLSIERTAQALGDISPWTVRAWITQGRITSVKLGSRRLVPQSEVARLISEATVPAMKRLPTKATEGRRKKGHTEGR